MIGEFINKIIAELSSNQFFSGGLILGVIGGLLVYLRKIPAVFFQFVKRKIIVDIEIMNTSECFDWFINWFSKSGHMSRSNHLLLSSGYRYNNSDSPDVTCDSDGKEEGNAVGPDILLSPGFGYHVFWLKGVPIWLSRDKQDKTSGSTYSPKLLESIHINTFKLYKKKILDIMEESKKEYYKNDYDTISVYTARYDSWTKAGDIPRRPIESVILDNDIMRDLADDIGKFKRNKDYYHVRSIPYRRGYMFSGLPGTGKTSCILVLASYFNANIYFFDLNTSSIDNQEFMNLMHKIPRQSFIVIEDIDTMGASNREKDNSLKHVSINGLLNAMDGIGSQEGRLLFVTTNHIEKVDKALLRPGRIDKHVRFGYASEYQIKQMFNMFEVDGNLLDKTLKNKSEITMAEVQDILVRETIEIDSKIGDRGHIGNDLVGKLVKPQDLQS